MSVTIKPFKSSRSLKAIKKKRINHSKPESEEDEGEKAKVEKSSRGFLLKDIEHDHNLKEKYFYDSDWSNLGEDSNEETCSENEFDEELFFNAKKKFISQKENSDLEDEPDKNNEDNNEEEDENDEEFDRDFDDLLERDGSDLDQLSKGVRSKKLFNKNIGKVLKPVILNDDTVDTFTLTTEQIKNIWSDPSSSEDETGEENMEKILAKAKHKERLKDMRLKSGFDFGANPSEFALNGLPKYGRELSDEENDFYSEIFSFSKLNISNKSQMDGKSHFSLDFDSDKPERGAIAFDPELDCSD